MDSLCDSDWSVLDFISRGILRFMDFTPQKVEAWIEMRPLEFAESSTSDNETIQRDPLDGLQQLGLRVAVVHLRHHFDL